MHVIGIDPGLANTGWAVIHFKHGQVTLCDAGTICPRGTLPIHGKLHYIYQTLNTTANRFTINCAAIENVFVNTNPKSSMFLCYARSAAMIALMNNNVEIFEYQPTTVKRRVFGSGHADKAQIAYVVNSTLRLPNDTKHSLHVTDAISIALCHVYSTKSVLF
ncbi:crossover junction endodeoxyribonuclease RuvC [Anaplasma platys]|uniref:Crossover junction endodeoxyribonuclease RuvC n=1 Tax=Anaplasma platys TaxID=949 RepID=A0A858PX39_9RICK|nr:crossover junction endodeoxyribonuclease RuvC [Anaplasma platys]QJC27156.1 crossover junction endodeoxyribonuclease RuvC [Anaplasma platys]